MVPRTQTRTHPIPLPQYDGLDLRSHSKADYCLAKTQIALCQPDFQGLTKHCHRCLHRLPLNFERRKIIPDYSFKLGFSDIPSNDILNNSYEGVIVSTSNVFNQELKFSTSVQLTNNLTLSNMEYRISLSANQQSDSGYNETYSQSFFPLGSSGKSGIP